MSETISLPADLMDLVGAVTQLAAARQAEAAEALYQRWIAANPAHPQLYIAHFNHACLLTEMGRTQAAMQALGEALALNADFLPARINLGGLHERSGSPDQALHHWREVAGRMVAITGSSISYKVTALRQMARLLSDHHRLAAAEAAMRQCLDIRPGQRDLIEQFVAVRLSQCNWPVVTGWEGMDRESLLRGMSPLSLLAYTDDPYMQLGLARSYAQHLVRPRTHLARSDRRGAKIPGRGRLRIGYLSSDLRDHAIGYLMSEVFELHDRSKVEIFAYYCGPESDSALQSRTRAAVEHWTDIRQMDDDAAAAKIAEDQIDILIDVNGYTRDARTAVFARRPAPVQINWLGYPGTLGTPYHHYIIADPWIIPPEAEHHFSERVLRLPCYQPNDRKRAIGPAPSRAEAGLPDDAFVFCCFNASQKISRFTIERWLTILHRTPGSVLWLLDSGEEMRTNLTAYAARRGLDPARLVFAPKRPNPDHLARYPLADLFLDTAPYGAHTTASDALWMGVPVLTLSGRSFASRVCGSLVRSAGLPDMVTTSPEEYVARAIALACAPAELAAMRATLRAERDRCDLFNMEKLVLSLEALFRKVAREHRAGRTPAPDMTNLDAYLEVGTGLDHEGVELLAVERLEEIYQAALTVRDAREPLPRDERLWR